MIKRLALALALAFSAAPAAAVCDAANTYAFAFSSRANATLSYGTTYTYTATTPLGASQNFAMSFAVNGLSGTTVNSIQMPAIGSLITTGTGEKTLQVGGTFSARTASVSGDIRTIRTTFTFATPVRDIVVTIHDIDFGSNQYRDWLHVVGSSGTASYVPALASPYGNNNGGTATAAGSTVRFGPGTSPFALSASEAVGTGTSTNTGVSNGDVLISFPQPVTSVTLRYGNYPLQIGESATGQQAFGISAIRFCPMPSLSVSKAAAPYASSGAERFHIPGADVVYAITVTNAGGSPVDLDGLVLTDVLPPGVTFYHGDFNPAAPGMGPFELVAGTSTVSLPASGRAYSNNGGASYTYTPAAGYDPQAQAVRLTPTGSMAANSSFSIRFRVRVN